MANLEFLKQTFGLDGQVAFVSGASSGIGARFARVLAEAGADVVLGARRVDRIEALAKTIEAETGRKALALALDVTSTESVEEVFAKAKDTLGVPTVVCNNAGIGLEAKAADKDESVWDDTMEVNLKGMWRVATTAAQLMIDADLQGSIINTASILGIGVTPKLMAYSVSKGGVLQMTRGMALELGRKGVRVNAICPGYFKTEINSAVLESEKGQYFLQNTPAGRHGAEHELDTALLMFAGPASTFVNGAHIAVDGAHNVRIL